MRVEKNVPEIRFEGFSGEWKLSQLSELALFNPKEELPVTFKYVDLESVKGTSLLGYREELKESAPSRAQRLAKKGDVFFQTVRPYQKNNYLFNMEEIDFVFSTGYAQLRPYYDGNFLLNLIQRDSFVKDVLDNCTGTSYPAINASILASLEVISPEGKEEQTAIGNTFQKLDNLINQHQQKHDKLSNIKKAMLEEMFPKQGETMPEIRFKGFSAEWEVRSWRDTVDISTNMVDPRSSQYGELFHVGPGNIESFTGMFYNNVLKVKDSNLISGKFHFNKGDIIYGKINPQLAKYVIAPFEGLASADAYVLSAKNGVVQNYLYAILQTEDFYKYTVSVSSRTGMPKINRDELNIYSYLSPDEAEQERIGNYFQKLDALINQHQQQITKLNNIKQACLSKMFV